MTDNRDKDKYELYEIPYLTTQGKFLGEITFFLLEKQKALGKGENIETQLAEAGGYEAKSIIVEIEADNPSTFRTDWKYKDETRYPAMVKTAATALRDFGLSGRYAISHNDGLLSIQKIGSGKIEEWTEPELKAAANAYFSMLTKELNGETYNKAQVNRELRNGSLSARSKGSIEFRMQNISATLEELCHPFIKGYLPRKNVGHEVKVKLKKIIFDNQYLQENLYRTEAETDKLDEKVNELMKQPLTGKPRGQKEPRNSNSETTTYYRDPLVKAWTLQRANGVCELCDKRAPFIDANGKPFLEHHHIVPLAKGGEDTVDNSVGLCPNCHRQCHHSQNKQEIAETLTKIK